MTTLDLAGNRIKKIEKIDHLEDLAEFWVSELSSEIAILSDEFVLLEASTTSAP